MNEKGTLQISTKIFRFENKDKTKGGDQLVVSIPEVLDPQYGMYVWPCAVVLAQYLWFHREMLPGKTIVEIGAGVSLPGIVAAKCGAHVTLSDRACLPVCLENCHKSCQMNGLTNVHVVGITWGQISPDLLLLPEVDIILGSDVFYEPGDFEDVLMTVYFLLHKNPHAQLWATYQERSAEWSIEALLLKWHMKCLHIPLESFHANKDHLAGSLLPGNPSIQMMIITLSKDHVEVT